jgi:hypothetical protein
MMPVVSAAVIKAEWDAIEQAYAVKALTPAELAFSALWAFDEASERGLCNCPIGDPQPDLVGD